MKVYHMCIWTAIAPPVDNVFAELLSHVFDVLANKSFILSMLWIKAPNNNNNNNLVSSFVRLHIVWVFF